MTETLLEGALGALPRQNLENPTQPSLIRWVTPKESEVEKFRTLVRDRFSVTLTTAEARELATRCIHIYQFMTHE